MTLPLTLSAAAVLLAAALTDLARRRIPNELVLTLALIGALRIAFEWAGGAGGLSAAVDIGACVVVFLLGVAAFQLNLVGGGDVKLLAAATLFLGAGALAPFLLVTSMAGGVLALAFLIGQRAAGADRPPPSLPYGVAIAAGGLFVAFAGQ
jgi:prepilin peptidase CpaA